MAWMSAAFGGGGTAASSGAATSGMSAGAPYAQGAGMTDPSAGYSVSAPMSGGGGMGGMGGFNLPSAVSDINKGTAGIAGYRRAMAESRVIKQVGGENQRRAYAIHRAVAGKIRAATGGQGTTMSGNPMAAEMDALEVARIIANDEKFRTKQAWIAKRDEANAYLWQGIEGFTGGILKGSGILSRRT